MRSFLAAASSVALVLLSCPAQAATRACAHRGDAAAAPENTLPAIALAVAKGAAMIEFDVYITKDAQLVVIHDGTVDRTTDGTGPVTGFTLEELRKLDAGSWFGPEFTGARVPTLREVLTIVPESTLCNVHLKKGAGLAARTATAIAEMDRLDQCFLACSLDQIHEAREAVPEIKTCNMSRQGGIREAYIEATIEAGAGFIQLHQKNGTEGLAQDVENLHRHGVTVNWYGANDEALMRCLAEASVDYVLTDSLALCMKVLGEGGEDAGGAERTADTQDNEGSSAIYLGRRENGAPLVFAMMRGESGPWAGHNAKKDGGCTQALQITERGSAFRVFDPRDSWPVRGRLNGAGQPTELWLGPEGPIALERIAGFGEEKATLRVGGMTATISVSFPVFTVQEEARQSALNAAIADLVARSKDSFIRGFIASASASSPSEEATPATAQPWSLDVMGARVHFFSECLVSMVFVSMRETGGTDGISYETLNLAWGDSKEPLELKLRDVFENGADFMATLSPALIDVLSAEATEWVESGEVSALKTEDLQDFTIAPGGLTFYFEPLDSGSYTRGPIEAVVPMERVEDILKKDVLK